MLRPLLKERNRAEALLALLLLWVIGVHFVLQEGQEQLAQDLSGVRHLGRVDKVREFINCLEWCFKKNYSSPLAAQSNDILYQNPGQAIQCYIYIAER